MQAFPTDRLKPLPGRLWGPADRLGISVPLQPFSLSIAEYDGEITVETALRLDRVALPPVGLEGLAGRNFAFPVNPEDGYIDGSICIDSAHHPVDITAIRFGSVAGNAIAVELEGDLILEFEPLGDFANTPWVCRTRLSRAALTDA